MGILADILELVEYAESGKERATPEKVIALAVYKEETQGKDSQKECLGGNRNGTSNRNNEQRKGYQAVRILPGH